MFSFQTVNLRLFLLALLLSILSFSAVADVWGYLDDKGVSHFANEKLDERYELFFRSNAMTSGHGDEKTNDPFAEALFPRPVNLPKAPPKLLAFFELSTSYKGVRHLMREASDRNSIDIELLQALIATESGFDRHAVSPKGAVGLMQIMPTTAERFGVVGDTNMSVDKKLTDPQVNIAAGTRILRHLLNRYAGQLELALAAYNAGEGAVFRAGNTIPKYKETQDYVKTVMQLYALLKPPTAITDLRRNANAYSPAYPLSPIASGRARLELSSQPTPAVVMAGGAVGRSNMLVPMQQVPLSVSYSSAHD